jgi:hypothetical protein
LQYQSEVLKQKKSKCREYANFKSAYKMAIFAPLPEREFSSLEIKSAYLSFRIAKFMNVLFKKRAFLIANPENFHSANVTKTFKLCIKKINAKNSSKQSFFRTDSDTKAPAPLLANRHHPRFGSRAILGR